MRNKVSFHTRIRMSQGLAMKVKFTLLVQFITCVCCASQHSYDIYPADMCPTDEECITLTEIVSERDKYFTSNVTLVLHPGNHSLHNKAVSVADVRNLTLQGYSSTSSSGPPNTKIFCVESSLSFTRVSELYIASINFVSCRSELSFTAAVFQDCSFENSTAISGGAIAVYNGSDIKFLGLTTFTGNQATDAGGAVLADWSILSFTGETTFTENESREGGAVYAENSNTLKFIGISNFRGNTALTHGGAVNAQKNNSFNFSGISSFEGNKLAVYGGAVYTSQMNMLTFTGEISFRDNIAKYGGAFFMANNNNISFNRSCSFEGNIASYGGSLCLRRNNNLRFNGKSTFKGNTAEFHGGALFVLFNNSLNLTGISSFEANSAADYGGAIFLYAYNEFSLAENTSFSSNTASFGGAIMEWHHSTTEITGNIAISKNKANFGGGIYVAGGVIAFQGTGNLHENHATQLGHGGLLLAVHSIVSFNGSYLITGNTAGYGGGLALFGINDVFLVLYPGTALSLDKNVAHRRGGAMYKRDNPFTYCTFSVEELQNRWDSCFIQFNLEPCKAATESVKHIVSYNITDRYLNFFNNTAGESGGTLYGGYMDSCVTCIDNIVMQGSAVFGQIANISVVSDFGVSSDPFKVCVCENNQPNCTLRTTHVQVYPGQVLSVSVVAVGQLDGAVPSVVRAVSEGLTITSDFKLTQPAGDNKQCTKLRYPLMSEGMSARLKLYSDEPCSNSGFPLTIHVIFLPCPVGFTLSDQEACVCEKRLQKYTQSCQIEKQVISRIKGETFWIGVDQHSELEGLILHPHCPFDYCTDEAVDFTLNSTDLQCSNGRSGMLCGACQSGHSLALGSSQCLSGCSNKFLALLLAFAVAGIALVAFLFLCRLTVAQGALNGLIFYANVLAVNQSVLFPSGSTNVLTVFIAWVNLDLGIETCFFVSLDAYFRTWLQFIFPIYIWVLVGFVI